MGPSYLHEAEALRAPRVRLAVGTLIQRCCTNPNSSCSCFLHVEWVVIEKKHGVARRRSRCSA